MGRGHPYPERPADLEDPYEGLSFKEQIRRLRQEWIAARRPGAPTLTEHDPPQDGQSFEDWYIKNTSEGQRLAARYMSQQPTEAQQKTLAIFRANVKRRLQNGKQSQ